MHSSPTLTVNLSAVRANYQLLKEKSSPAACAAVVKADAYGLGMPAIANALADAGCTMFYVATLKEGIALREILPEAQIGVFHGPYSGEEREFAAHTLMPVLNHAEQLARWNYALPYALHVDTGMTRLGIDYQSLSARHTSLSAPPSLLLSHLACANTPDHPMNQKQLAALQHARVLFPDVPVSFANSSGIFLDGDYHFQQVRPGCALYGITPNANLPNPMQHVATLSAPILQIRTLEDDADIGYGATYHAPAGNRIAVLQIGYADGYNRLLGGRANVRIAGYVVPVVGRVSMDMITADVTNIPLSVLETATHADCLWEGYDVNIMAENLDTIGYEIFTRIGARVQRLYV